MIKQAEKLYDEEKYQEAIDLLLDNPSKKDKQNPDYWLWLGWCYYHENFEDNKKKIIESLTKGIKLYEENPKPFTDLKEDIKESKNLIVKAYAKIGLDDINNKKTVEKCCEYILSHIDDCSDFDSFAQAGIFLSLTMPSGYSDFREIDTGLELLQKADDLFDSNVGLDRIEFDLIRNFAFSQKGIQCFVEGDFNNVQVYVEKILASENKIPGDGVDPLLLNIGTFLAMGYTNRFFIILNDDLFPIASAYLHKCLTNENRDIQDGGNIWLGLLNYENEKVAWNYLSKISKSNKEYYDSVIFFNALINLRDRPKEAIKELKSLNNSEVIDKVVVDLFLCVMHFEDKQDEKGSELINSLSRSNFTGVLTICLPLYDLICYLYLKQDDALDNLKGWTQKYPDSELIKEYLDIAEKSTIENDEFIDFKLINIPINWNYIINRSDLTDEITTESLQIPKSLLRSKLKSKPFQLSGGFKIDNKTNIYSLISLVPRENFRIALIGKKHKNIIQLKRIRDNTVVTDYITDEFFSFLRILYEERKTKKNDYRIYLTDEPSELIKYFLKDTYGNRMFMWINSKAQKSTLVNRINNLFPNLIITEYGNNSEQYYILDHGISTDH